MSHRNTRDSNQGKRTMLIILCSILAVIFTAMVAGAVYMEYLMGKIGRTQETSLPTLSQEEIEAIQHPEKEEGGTAPTLNSEDVTWNDGDAELLGGDHVVNILLIGQDRREGEGRARSDAMILCSFNKNAKTITLTSIMRDLYVPIPGYLDNRINAAYQLGGIDLLNRTITQNFGVEIHGNVEVDFSQFRQIIDLLGGVDISLTEAEANHLNGQNGTWNLVTGKNHLTGEQALAYSRIRYIGNADYGRTNRQRTVLTALFQAYKNTNVTGMLMLLDDLLPMVTTDLTNKEMVGYVMELSGLLASGEIKTQRIPADGAFYEATIRGMQVLVPDLEANRKILKETLAP